MAPAVASGRLARLEKELGADLLHRTTRRVALSLEGAEFLPFAKEMLAQQDAALAALGQSEAIARGTLRFTAPSTFAQLYIASLLPEFLEQQPGITLDLRLSDAQFNLIEGSFDLALRNSPLEDSSMKGRKLADDRRILCASPDYLERAGTPQTAKELDGHELISFKEVASRDLVAGDGTVGIFDPRKSGCRLVMDDGLSQKLATMAGAGISINSLWSVHAELANGSLVRVLPNFLVADDSVLWLIYPNSNVLTTKVRVFIDFLLERIGRSPPWLSEEESSPDEG